ncbi:MAG: hypothetical protein A3G83_09225 [Betaproteobacteria bacterium RIFCSPLOWO2_12_FULL_68_20]|nr:MAG: hypothetical protein A3G83_09225 [Betaproteobacteria bacterium RIFCSPLOWO2_12_FULL_68_20]
MLEAAGLECVRQSRTLFTGLSFSLRGGELLRVAGANGSGKTSLLRIVCGLLSPTAGEVRWQGMGIQRLREEYSRQLLYVGHAAAVKDDLTAAENLSIACTLAGMPVAPPAVRQALEQYGLPPGEIPVRRLSQGQRRRAALARLLLSESLPLWLLDEPFAALDTAAAELTRALIEAHIARGATVVYATHQEVGIEAARIINLETAAA